MKVYCCTTQSFGNNLMPSSLPIQTLGCHLTLEAARASLEPLRQNRDMEWTQIVEHADGMGFTIGPSGGISMSHLSARIQEVDVPALKDWSDRPESTRATILNRLVVCLEGDVAFLRPQRAPHFQQELGAVLSLITILKSLMPDQ